MWAMHEGEMDLAHLNLFTGNRLAAQDEDVAMSQTLTDGIEVVARRRTKSGSGSSSMLMKRVPSPQPDGWGGGQVTAAP